MVLIEAMSCGLPGVCFDFKCGPKDLIKDGENGLLVPEDDIPALAKAMERMMREGELRKQMSDKSLDIRSKYSEEKIMEQWEMCFKRMLA